MGDWVPIRDAAQRLGVSEDTIRRRLHHGKLAGERRPTPQGFTWLVELPDAIPATARAGPSSASLSELAEGRDGEIRRLEETIAILRAELDTRHREVQELHILLDRFQAALPIPLPMPSEPTNAPPQDIRASPTQMRTHSRWWRRAWLWWKRV